MKEQTCTITATPAIEQAVMDLIMALREWAGDDMPAGSRIVDINITNLGEFENLGEFGEAHIKFETTD